MTVPSIFVAVEAVAAALGAWAIIFLLWPRASRTRFRRVMWQTRDALVDDVVAGRIQPSPPADRLLRSLHVSIVSMAPATITRVLIVVGATYRSTDHDDFETWLRLEEAPERDRELLRTYMNTRQKAAVIHLAGGSLGGVCALIASAFVAGCLVVLGKVPTAAKLALGEGGAQQTGARRPRSERSPHPIFATARPDQRPTRAVTMGFLQSMADLEVNVPPSVGDALVRDQLAFACP